jgi:hypothetical protein
MSLLLAALLLAAPEPAAELLARGESLLEDLEYDLAAEELMRAAAARDATPAQRTRAHLLAGIANRIAGRDVDARLSFRNVLLAAPDTELPENTSPKVRAFFEAVRQEVAAERAAEVAGGSGSSPAAAPGGLPPPDRRPSALPWVVAGTAGAGAVAALGVSAFSFLAATIASSELDAAIEEYRRAPNAETRRALTDRSRSAIDAVYLHNCLLLPLGVVCFPAGALGAGAASLWGIADQERAGAAE